MSLDTLIRTQTSAYLSGSVGFDEFKRWFVSATWNVEREDNAETRVLVVFITARLSEFMDGDITEEELKRQVREQLQAVSRSS